MINSRLPAAMTLLAYLAAGLALSVSWAQLRQVLKMQGGLPSGEYISFALPLAILFGSCVLWRMLGHLFNRAARARSFGAALAFVLVGAVCNEGVSVFTSAMSLSMGVHHRIQQDIEQTAQHQAAQQANTAAAAAAARLADNLASMPERYYKRGNETAAQLERLLEAQTKLAEQSSNTSGSSTQRTLESFGASMGWSADQLQTRWAWLLAGCLSLIVLAVQIGLGSLSDGVLAEKTGQRGLFDDDDAPEVAGTAKKTSGLSVVQ